MKPCTRNAARSGSPAATPATSSQVVPAGSLAEIMEKLNKIDVELTRIKPMWGEISDIKKSLEFALAAMSDTEKRVEAIEKRLETVDQIVSEVASIKKSMDIFRYELDERDQLSRMKNLEIKNVPLTKGENLLCIAQKIGDQMGFKLQPEDVDVVTRVATKSAQVKPIIIRFASRRRKEEYLALFKKARKITTTDLKYSGPEAVIYVNNHLTVKNKILLSKVKIKAGEAGFKFVWVKDCKILVRKNDSSPAFLVRREEDLQKIS